VPLSLVTLVHHLVVRVVLAPPGVSLLRSRTLASRLLVPGVTFAGGTRGTAVIPKRGLVCTRALKNVSRSIESHPGASARSSLVDRPLRRNAKGAIYSRSVGRLPRSRCDRDEGIQVCRRSMRKRFAGAIDRHKEARTLGAARTRRRRLRLRRL